MTKNIKKFSVLLNNLRIKKGLSLRQACKLTKYDPSNWSKIERGLIPPPSDEKTLKKWARVLGLAGNKKLIQEFIDKAIIGQGIIPQDILSQSKIVEYLPAFFRTLRNKKPTKKEINQLLKLIRKA